MRGVYTLLILMMTGCTVDTVNVHTTDALKMFTVDACLNAEIATDVDAESNETSD